MAFVTPGQEFIAGYPQPRQGSPTLEELLYRCLAALLIVNGGRHQMGYSPAVAGDGDGLALLNLSQEFRQVGFGFCCCDLSHVVTPTGYFDWSFYDTTALR